MRVLKKILINLSISILAITVVFLLTEAGLQFFYPQRLISHNPGMYTPDPDLGYRLTPNYIGQAKSYEYNHEIRINSIALRDEEYKVIKPEGIYRILILGDSFVFNYGIQYGLGFDALLEKYLNQNNVDSKYSGFEVINASIGGYEPYDELKYYRKFLKQLTPDLVIMGFYEGNDFSGLRNKVESNPEIRQFNLGTSRGILEWINDILESRSHLYMFFRNRLEYLRFKMGLTDHYIPRYLFVGETRAYKDTRLLFKEIAKEFEKGPGLFIFMIPHRISVDKKYREDMLSIYDIKPESIDINKPKEGFSSLLHDFQIEGIDLTRIFFQEGASSLYYPIDGHWNVEGNKVTAKTLYPLIVEMINRAR